MKNILIHGLGQNHKSWNETIKFLEIDNIDVLCPALFKMSSGNSNDYQNIFSSFSDFCNNQEGKLNLCGLSLGGILALDYVKKYPEYKEYPLCPPRQKVAPKSCAYILSPEILAGQQPWILQYSHALF